jgi:hypothetical protein
VPWSYFNTTCWAPTSTGYLSSLPAAISQVQVEVASGSGVTRWDLCVSAMTF